MQPTVMTEDVAASRIFSISNSTSASSSIGNAIVADVRAQDQVHRDVAHDKSQCVENFPLPAGGNRRIQQAIPA